MAPTDKQQADEAARQAALAEKRFRETAATIKRAVAEIVDRCVEKASQDGIFPSEVLCYQAVGAITSLMQPGHAVLMMEAIKANYLRSTSQMGQQSAQLQDVVNGLIERVGKLEYEATK